MGCITFIFSLKYNRTLEVYILKNDTNSNSFFCSLKTFFHSFDDPFIKKGMYKNYENKSCKSYKNITYPFFQGM